MNIFHEPHASCRIETATNVLFVDPQAEHVAKPPKGMTAVLIHTRENDSVGGDDVRLANAPGEYGIGELNIRGIANPASDEDGTMAVDVIYGVDTANLTVCLIGSISSMPSDGTASDISGSQVVFVDTDLNRLDINELGRFIRSIEPRLVVARGAATQKLSQELAAGDVQTSHKVSVNPRSFSEGKIVFHTLEPKP